MSLDKTQRELLMLEYQVVLDGHRSRDELVPREIVYMLQAFLIFLMLLVAAQAFLTFDRAFAIVIFILIGLAGLVCLVAFLIDIQANTSCKRALRKRASEIEEILNSEHLKHWQIIRNRDMYLEESLLKNRAGGTFLHGQNTFHLGNVGENRATMIITQE